MFERIVPEVVRVCESRDYRSDVALFAEERAALGRAVEKRRQEFTTVRACAREALAGLGVAAVPIVPGERGAPEWPAGVVGSMTHCRGYHAAVAALDRDLDSIGIDAERDAALPPGVLELVAAPDEVEHVNSLPSGGLAWDRLLFSAKESVYKAWFPRTRRWLGFDDVTVALRSDGTFTVRLLVDAPVRGGQRWDQIAGRWLAAHGLILTTVTLPLGCETNGAPVERRRLGEPDDAEGQSSCP